ncbi:MAG: 16S rRNA (cytosine(1402)-N(4))-methyltransferase RsmH [Pseudomonadota bacterium]
MWINRSRHVPVLRDEAVSALTTAGAGTYIDATFGGGGYAEAILGVAGARVIGLDRDPEAAVRGAALAAANSQFAMLEGRFGELTGLLAERGVDKVDGLVADIGVSSFQLDQAERGFSFRADGPLDMRMSQSGRSAADLVNEAGEAELADLIYRLGEEPQSRRIARAIVRQRSQRPIRTTGELQAIVATAKGRGRPGRDPATQTFQALRMAVNDELAELDALLTQCLTLLRPGGRLVVVTFHSLEDRLVKRFVDAAGGSRSEGSRHAPAIVAGPAKLRWVHRRVIKPSATEIEHNPRARSAKLRVAERTEEDLAESDPELSSLLWRAAA